MAGLVTFTYLFPKDTTDNTTRQDVWCCPATWKPAHSVVATATLFLIFAHTLRIVFSQICFQKNIFSCWRKTDHPTRHPATKPTPTCDCYRGICWNLFSWRLSVGFLFFSLSTENGKPHVSGKINKKNTKNKNNHTGCVLFKTRPVSQHFKIVVEHKIIWNTATEKCKAENSFKI